MNITDTRVRIIENSDSKLKAIASIVIEGCFAIHDIKIIEGNEGVFIAMPSRKTAEGTFKDIAHPINSETREMVKNVILDAYKKAVEEI
ncbi:MAG: septation regulator SpoVG [Clostridia bacterium]|nr:septation regulator SpoVG [Clostridia bacterium]MBO7325901.1 septation regulator SpoVG [Clostridia bacterium]